MVVIDVRIERVERGLIPMPGYLVVGQDATEPIGHLLQKSPMHPSSAANARDALVPGFVRAADAPVEPVQTADGCLRAGVVGPVRLTGSVVAHRKVDLRLVP